MQCEFSKAELVTLDLAVIERAMRMKSEMLAQQSDKHLLEASVKRLDALHEKLDKLIEEGSHE